jgi:hypothetical protein
MKGKCLPFYSSIGCQIVVFGIVVNPGLCLDDPEKAGACPESSLRCVRSAPVVVHGFVSALPGEPSFWVLERQAVGWDHWSRSGLAGSTMVRE